MRRRGAECVARNFCHVRIFECFELNLSPLSSCSFQKKTSSPPSEAGIISVHPFCLGLLYYRSFEFVGLLNVARCYVLNSLVYLLRFFVRNKKLACDATPRRGTRRRTRGHFVFVKFYSFWAVFWRDVHLCFWNMLALEEFFIACDVVSAQVSDCKIPTTGLFRFEAEPL
jgi:hypothetical protein